MSARDSAAGLRCSRAALIEAGVADPVWCEITKSKKATKQVRRLLAEGVERLVVWGGDGTVRRCIDTIVGDDAKVEVAIVPAGTANLLATALNIPGNVAGAVDIAVNGMVRPIDVGVVNGKTFAVMAGTGFDTLMIRDTDTKAKRRLGKLSYVRAGVKNLGASGAKARSMSTENVGSRAALRVSWSATWGASSAASVCSRTPDSTTACSMSVCSPLGRGAIGSASDCAPSSIVSTPRHSWR